MDKDKFKEIFTRYLEVGFDVLDIVLTDDRVVIFDAKKHNYSICESYFWFGKNGLSTTIDYKIIKGLAI